MLDGDHHDDSRQGDSRQERHDREHTVNARAGLRLRSLERKRKTGRQRRGQRFNRAGMAQYESEWPRLIETAHVGQLHQKQERRRGGLEASHDRVRSEFEQRPDLDRSKEGLEEATNADR